jgi:uncharacterized protein YwgA
MISLISDKMKEYSHTLGKTAVMKLLFILQETLNVPLGYSFSLYTYGPYCSDVLSDLDFAESVKGVTITRLRYPNGNIGYEVLPGEDNRVVQETASQFVTEYKEEVEIAIKVFGAKSARDLELYSTIIYMFNNFEENKWSDDDNEIIESVLQVKPHFLNSDVKNGIDWLKSNWFSRIYHSA